jgi:hypothetical protein
LEIVQKLPSDLEEIQKPSKKNRTSLRAKTMRESNATSPSKHKLIGTTKKNTEVPKIAHQKADSSNKQSRSRNKELAGVPSVKDARNFKNKPVIKNLIRTAKRKTFIAKIQEDVDKSNLTDLQNTLDSQNHSQIASL